jgi:Fic family protein
VISTGRALAELKGLGETIPDQNILINSIILQEAKASSEIENIITTNDALYQAVSSKEEKDPATKEVLRYREALWTAFNGLKDRRMLTTNLFISIVQEIKHAEIGIRKTPGTRLQNDLTGETVYTPPGGEETIRAKLANLEKYIHGEGGIDPLLQVAVVHYQFEAIHPFSDGNGRTGRIIILLYLILQDLLKLPVLYISKYITESKNEYYRLIRRLLLKVIGLHGFYICFRQSRRPPFSREIASCQFGPLYMTRLKRSAQSYLNGFIPRIWWSVFSNIPIQRCSFWWTAVSQNARPQRNI